MRSFIKSTCVGMASMAALNSADALMITARPESSSFRRVPVCDRTIKAGRANNSSVFATSASTGVLRRNTNFDDTHRNREDGLGFIANRERVACNGKLPNLDRVHKGGNALCFNSTNNTERSFKSSTTTSRTNRTNTSTARTDVCAQTAYDRNDGLGFAPKAARVESFGKFANLDQVHVNRDGRGLQPKNNAFRLAASGMGL